MTKTEEPQETGLTSAKELADRYVALWNEPDPERRRRLIAGLWEEDGAHILQPPQEVRVVAARPGIGMTAVFEAHGHAAIEARATSAYEEWVASEGLSFRHRDDVDRVGDAIKFHWEALDEDGKLFAVGLNFLVVGADGRILRDYSFVVG